MKSLISFITLLFLINFSFAANSRLLQGRGGKGGGGKDESSEENKLCACPAIEDPVCCDGKDYGNECNARCDGDIPFPVKFYCQSGKCEDQNDCVCPMIFEPFCCTNDKGEKTTHPSLCSAVCDDEKESECQRGECRIIDGACTLELKPLCCTGQDYPNECSAKYAGVQNIDECKEGECKNQLCACTQQFDPWCCDGEGVGNDCLAECRGYDLDRDCVHETCHDPDCICTQQWDPVCCEGKTYGNACEAECDGITGDELIEDCKMKQCEDQSDCVCTDDYSPICCNGIDFPNECDAKCKGVGKPEKCRKGPCKDQCNKCACGLIWEPTCCDGKTYSNECDAECNGIKDVDEDCKEDVCQLLSSGKGGKDKEDIVGGYGKCEKEKLKDIQEYVDKIKDDILELAEEDASCSVKVIDALEQVVNGMNYKVTLKICNLSGYVISFHVPLDSDMPQDLELIIKPGSGCLLGGFCDVDAETLDVIKKDVEGVEADIIRLMQEKGWNIADGVSVEVVSATSQVVAGTFYRVILKVDSTEEVEVKYFIELADASREVKQLELLTEPLLKSSGKGGKDKDDILGGYEKCDKEKLKDIQEYVDKIKDDILVLVEEDADCSVKVMFAEQQLVNGMNYKVTLKICNLSGYVISFHVPLDSDMPQDLVLITKPGSECMPGGFCDVEDLDKVKADVKLIEDDIRKLLEVDDSYSIEVLSAQSQVSYRVTIIYRVTIEAKSDAGFIQTDIEYLIHPESDTPEDIKLVEVDLGCIPGGFCDVDAETLIVIKKDVEGVEADIIRLMQEKGYNIADGVSVDVVSAKSQVVAGTYYRVILKVDNTEEVEVKYFIELAAASREVKELELLTEPAMVKVSALKDGGEKIMVFCEEGYVLRKGECIKEEAEDDVASESESSETDNPGYGVESSESSESSEPETTEEKEEDGAVWRGEEEKGAVDCEEGKRLRNGECVDDVADKNEENKEEKDKTKDERGRGDGDNDDGDKEEEESESSEPETTKETATARGGEDNGAFDGSPESTEFSESPESPEFPARGDKKLDDCECPLVFAPVCCTKGNKKAEYATECDAECDGCDKLKCVPGKCTSMEASQSSESSESSDGDEENEEDESSESSQQDESKAAGEQEKGAVDCEEGKRLRNGECVEDVPDKNEENKEEKDKTKDERGRGDDDGDDDDKEEDEPKSESSESSEPETTEEKEYSVEARGEQEKGAVDCEEGQRLRNGECVDDVADKNEENKEEKDKTKDERGRGDGDNDDDDDDDDNDYDGDDISWRAAGDIGKIDEECAKECEDEEDDYYCCSGQQYDNPCLAKCAGYKKPEKKCEIHGKCNEDQECVCSMDINYVCCGDNEQFDNQCSAECDGFNYKKECTDGECSGGSTPSEPPKACPEEKDLICCNGIQYDNPCLAECDNIDVPAEDQEECYMGECKDECICSTEYNPYCCAGTTYSNPCNARCDGILTPRLTCLKGSCDSQICGCPFIYAPICCNEENYPNTCTAKCVNIDNPEETCTVGKCEEEECVCTREYNPFCCDGKTYSNPCKARCDGHKFINFKCDRGICERKEPCFCPLNHEPVCCNKDTNDEQEYGNFCQAQCDLGGTGILGTLEAIKVCEAGSCEPDVGCVCNTKWDPVCCEGARTFSNMCQARCDGFDRTQCTANGACEDIRICTMEYMALCCNGETYSNPCMAEADGIEEPAEDQTDKCSLGECDRPSICTADYDPWCCGGITYGNICMAKDAGYEDPEEDCKEGRCDHSICTLEYNPQCCEGETYANPCMAEKSGIDAPAEDNCIAGRCEDQKCVCTAVYDPYCCGGIDYGSKCQAECNGFLDIDNQCRQGTCKGTCICTLEYEPTCCNGVATDSKDKTYGNKCQAECDGFDVDDENQCKTGHCSEKPEGCACTMDINPICCDGKTYPNPCAAECDGVDKPAEFQSHRCVMGICDKHCICTKESNPICCDGDDYSNPCTARCDGVHNPWSCSHGRCDQQDEDCICTREYKPYCCDDKDYSNGCLAECDNHDIKDDNVCKRGRCDGNCLCTLEEEPVCCGEGGRRREYSNQCVANCAGFEDSECKEGTCDDLSICTIEYEPYCCNDKTYGNKCMVKKDNLDILTDCERGECIDKLCICHPIYAPICCDGVNYDNSCVAECDDISDPDKKCTSGKCGSDNICRCTLEDDPLCCLGKTYYNPCSAECAGYDGPAELNDDCEVGKCEELSICACTKELKPVCCAGIDYDNECSAECDGVEKPALSQEECSLGKCSDQNVCVCTREFNPQCCTDKDGNKEDYSNPCIAACDGISNPNKKCRPGKCSDDELCVCTREYTALCCDGNDYSNACLAKCDNINDIVAECRLGQCEDDAVCKCTADLNPLCCRGEDYDNSCLARCDGVFGPEYFCQKGTCDSQPATCTLQYDPTCCDGEDYSNPCFAERDGFLDAQNNEKCQAGKCCDVCGCDKKLDLICCDEKQYSNPCMATCAGFEDAGNNEECESGICNKDCYCTRGLNPICCDGKLFSNPCTAQCAGFEDAEKNTECELGRCSTSCACTKELKPVCCDGKTYSNSCMAECAGFKDCGKNPECTEGACIGQESEEEEEEKANGDAEDAKSDSSEQEIWFACTANLNYICCEDKFGIKITYDNPCLAEKQGGIEEPAETNKACSMGKCGEEEDCECTLEEDPYCCWDVEYANPCKAKCAGVKNPEKKCDKGKCGESSPSESCDECDDEKDDPICCDLEKDYRNPCEAECNGYSDAAKNEKCVLGKCDEIYPCKCPLIYDAVCCDGVDYASQCDADCEEAKNCKSGECEKETDCICTRDYIPYCCNDKDDYNNKCLLECNNEDIEKCKLGSCASIDCGCTEEQDPWCCDGKTFDNECVAKCNSKDCTKTDQCKKGVCEDEEGAAVGTSTYNGIFSLGKPSGSSQWNIMIVIIQLCILAVCCLSLGLSISFCFKNPNKLINGMGKSQESFGRDQ